MSTRKDKFRHLQYRLKRQGMLELDTWLSALQPVLETDNKEVLKAIELLLAAEAPELFAMQNGKKPIPKELEPWLKL